jgi:hypothetical protein
MKKLFLLLLPVATLLFYFSCQQLPTESEKPVNTVSVLNLEADGIYYDLIAGQNITVGNVFVWNDGTDLHVEYNITDLDWCLTETHMHVATTLDGIPQTKKGNPIPGQFDYKNEDLINCATYDSYTIPLLDIDPNWICDQELFIAAHAVVLEQQEETAWGGEEPFPGKNWATYFYYEVTCETPPPPPPGDCAECDGKVTELLLQYNGANPGQVEIIQKNGDVVFNSFLSPGDVFPIVGTDNGTFGNEIKIYVDGNENARIHTSCSLP